MLALRLYIVGIDSANANNDNSSELNHASEDYDSLKEFIQHFYLKHYSVAWLELESYTTRDTNNDEGGLLDFIGVD
ncbi:hypothetical protein [Helicobacter pylori]